MDTRQILEEFPAYLEANRLARPQHIPFLRRWAERYVNAPADPALAPDDRLRTFLAALEQTPGVADWQVRQAEDAVVLLRQFVATRRPQASRAGATPPSAAGDAAVLLPGVPVVVGEAWTKTLSAARDLLRLRRYSPKTETAYLDWARRFAAYCGNRPPLTLAEGDVKRYLTHLAMERHVSASTQNQAFCGLLFLFREVLLQPLDGLQDTVRARRGEKLPVVFSQEEVQRLLAAMEGTTKLMAQITYGAGLRLMECVRLRVKDLDLDQHRLLVRSGKGDKDRSTLLPQGLLAPLRKHLARVKELHERDLAQGHGEIRLPDALGRKYPNAGREWPWQYVFPSSILSPDREDGVLRRFHTAESNLQKGVREALRKAQIVTHLLRSGRVTERDLVAQGNGSTEAVVRGTYNHSKLEQARAAAVRVAAAMPEVKW